MNASRYRWKTLKEVGPESVQAPPMESVPKAIRQYVNDVAHVHQVAPGLVLPLVIGALSAAAGKMKIVPHAGLESRLNLFVAVVAPPGDGKGPALNAAVFPLRDWEFEKRELEFEETDVKEPTRIIVDDVSPAGLIDRLLSQRGRVALISEEAGGLVALLGNRSNPERADLIVKAHDGSTIVVDRKHQSISISDPALALVVTLQPEVLKAVAGSKYLRARGLAARFLYSMPPSLVGRRSYENRAVEENVKLQYDSALRQILELSCGPYALELSDDALDRWRKHQGRIERHMRPGGPLNSIPDWASKQAFRVLAIAGLFHLAMSPTEKVVPKSAMKMACGVGSWLEQNAVAALAPKANRLALLDEALIQWARPLYAKAKADGGARPHYFKLREFYRHRPRFRTDVKVLLPALEKLGRARLVRPAKGKKGTTGVPPTRISINPKLLR